VSLGYWFPRISKRGLRAYYGMTIEK
jgi:hypothetical protein